MSLLDVFHEFPNGICDTQWSLGSMSYNPHLTWDVVSKYKNGMDDQNTWCPDGLSGSKCLNDEIIKTYQLPWNMKILSRNESITLDLIKNYDLKWSQKDLSVRSDVDWSEIIAKGTISNIPISMDGISSNPSIPKGYIERYMSINGKKWNLELLSMNEGGLDWSTVMRHPSGMSGKEWCWSNLSANKTLKWSYVEELRNKFQSFYLSSNPSIPLDILSQCPVGPDGKRWDVDEVSMNDGLTPQFIDSHIMNFHGDPLNVEYLSKNPAITIDIVKKYPELDWDYGDLATILPWQQVEDNIQLFNGFIDDVSSNKGIQFSFVKNNLDGLFNQSWDAVILSEYINC